MAIRSFLAFELPPDIRSTVEMALNEARQHGLDVKWVPINNIHLTMVFLGNINQEDLPDMDREIQEICSQTEPFETSLKEMGCFPGRRNPRVIWLGLTGSTERMSIFRDELQNQLLPFGVTPEKRPFRPHLTLGRFKRTDKRNASKPDNLCQNYQDLKGPVRTLSELIQFKSDLRPTGAVYTKIAAWELRREEGRVKSEK